MIFLWQAGALMVFVSPSQTSPLEFALATHDICADGAATVAAATWEKLARGPRWVDIYKYICHLIGACKIPLIVFSALWNGPKHTRPERLTHMGKVFNSYSMFICAWQMQNLITLYALYAGFSAFCLSISIWMWWMGTASWSDDEKLTLFKY